MKIMVLYYKQQKYFFELTLFFLFQPTIHFRIVFADLVTFIYFDFKPVCLKS